MLIQYRRRGGPDAPPRPWIELYIAGQKITHYALVDSGADHSLIPKDLARWIGADYDPKVTQDGGGAGGSTFKFHVGTNQLSIQTEVGGLTFDAPFIAESDHFIVGRHDFFRRYKVTFNERDSYMEIEPFDTDRADN